MMDGANKAAFLEMHWQIEYILDIKTLGLKIAPNRNEKEPWVSSPSTTTFGGKKHWLLVIEDSANYAESYFSKEKLSLKNVIVLI